MNERKQEKQWRGGKGKVHVRKRDKENGKMGEVRKMTLGEVK